MLSRKKRLNFPPLMVIFLPTMMRRIITGLGKEKNRVDGYLLLSKVLYNASIFKDSN